MLLQICIVIVENKHNSARHNHTYKIIQIDQRKKHNNSNTHSKFLLRIEAQYRIQCAQQQTIGKFK